MKAELVLNGKSFPIGGRSIANMIFEIADVKENTSFFALLVDYPSSLVKQHISYKTNLNEETIDKLIDTGDVIVLSALSSNASLVEKLNLEQVKKIMDSKYYEVLRNLIYQAMNNPKVFDSYFFEKMARHPDSEIRVTLAQYCPFDNKEILMQLAKDEDENVSVEAKIRLKEL